MIDKSYEIASHLRSIRTAVWILAWLAIISMAIGATSWIVVGVIGASLI